MAQSKKYVVLADIESVRVPFGAFAAALDEVAKLGEIAGCKFYGYSAKRTKDYGAFIQENAYDALSALPRKRKGKLDLRQVIDAARLAQYPNIDGFFLIYGSGDITPLIAYLKAYGKDVIAGVIEPDKNSVLCNKIITLDTNATVQKVLDSGYRKVAVPAAKAAPAPKAAPKAEAPKAEPAPAPAPAPVAEEPKAEPAPAAEAPKNNDDDEMFNVLLGQLNKMINS